MRCAALTCIPPAGRSQVGPGYQIVDEFWHSDLASTEDNAHKMPITVYEQFFEPIARVHGLPDQVVTDKGNEWRLLAFACFLAARLAQRLGGRLPHRFTSSQHNVSAAASLST